MAAFGWMGTAEHLIWPSLIEAFRENCSPFHIPRFYRWSWRILRIAFPFSKARPLMLFSRRLFTFQRTQSENIPFSSLTFYWELFSNLPTKNFKIFKIFFFRL